VAHAENIESKLVIPADIVVLLQSGGPTRCGAGRSPGRSPTRGMQKWPGSRLPQTTVSRLAARFCLLSLSAANWQSDMSRFPQLGSALMELSKSAIETGALAVD
jgi:hypothetical protein